MSSNKKKSPGSKKNPATVKLTRRQLLDGSIDALTPENVTNSGKNDRGWMDSSGVKAIGLGGIFTETPDPVEKFISNNAYARAGFAQMQIELYPPLEVCGNYGQGREHQPTTRENLLQFLKYQVGERENTFYKAGLYTVDENCPRIGHPKELSSTSGDDTTTNADQIVLYWYERKCDAKGSGDLPEDLTAKEQFAALYFSGRAIVIVQATNFERHNQSIDVMDIVSSIRYIKETPYFGFSDIGLNPSSLTFHSVPRTPPTDGMPKLCFHCGKRETTSKQCSRCKVAVCSAECQKKDWKRHKKGECLPRIENAGGESST